MPFYDPKKSRHHELDMGGGGRPPAQPGQGGTGGSTDDTVFKQFGGGGGIGGIPGLGGGGGDTTGQGGQEIPPGELIWGGGMQTDQQQGQQEQFDFSQTDPDSFTPTEYNTEGFNMPTLGTHGREGAGVGGSIGGQFGGHTVGPLIPGQDQMTDETLPIQTMELDLTEEEDFRDRGSLDDRNLGRDDDPYEREVDEDMPGYFDLREFGDDHVIGPIDRNFQDDVFTPAEVKEQIEQSEKEAWRDRGAGIDEYLDRVFGDQASFDPVRAQLEAERDAAQRRFSEGMAGRGMEASGAAAAGLADIDQAFWRDLASEEQAFRQQGIENAQAAASMLFQDEWGEMDRDHQEAMTKLMFELDRKRKMGDDYNPDVGEYEMQIIRDMFNKEDLDEQDRIFLEGMLRNVFGDKFVDEWFGKEIDGEEINGEEKPVITVDEEDTGVKGTPKGELGPAGEDDYSEDDIRDIFSKYLPGGYRRKKEDPKTMRDIFGKYLPGDY